MDNGHFRKCPHGCSCDLHSFFAFSHFWDAFNLWLYAPLFDTVVISATLLVSLTFFFFLRSPSTWDFFWTYGLFHIVLDFFYFHLSVFHLRHFDKNTFNLQHIETLFETAKPFISAMLASLIIFLFTTLQRETFCTRFWQIVMTHLLDVVIVLFAEHAVFYYPYSNLRLFATRLSYTYMTLCVFICMIYLFFFSCLHTLKWYYLSMSYKVTRILEYTYT